MNSKKIWATSFLALFAAACSTGTSVTPPTPAPQRVSTKGAVRVHGDLGPSRPVAVAPSPSGPTDDEMEKVDTEAAARVAAAMGRLEPGFAPLATPRRILSFDVPTNPGRVNVEVPAEVARGGLTIEVQQPNSHIALSG